ncbi:MAG: glucose-1-phosphate cytidylyltransferase [Alphaproteobacteria bacterium]
MVTEAVILCGGLGTRLREETEFRPKPMVHIGEYPILWHIMKRYSAFGVKRFILCLGYKGDVIRDYFLNYRYHRADFSVQLKNGAISLDQRTPLEDWEVVLAETGERTLTGSRIARALKHVTGRSFFATYGDGVADVNLNALLAHHTESGKAATLTSVLPPSRFGEVRSEGGIVEFFAEKPQVEAGSINGGFMVFDKPALQKYLPVDGLREPDCSLEGEVLSRLAADKQLAAYEHKGFWQCMDTHREMELLNTIYSKGSAPWLMKNGICFSGRENASLSPVTPVSSAAG